MTDYRYPEIAAKWLKGESAGQIALYFKVSRNTIVGRLNRMGLMGTTEGERGYIKPPRKPTRNPNAKRLRGDWDIKTFEPYEARKARLAMERANGLR